MPVRPQIDLHNTLLGSPHIVISHLRCYAEVHHANKGKETVSVKIPPPPVSGLDKYLDNLLVKHAKS